MLLQSRLCNIVELSRARWPGKASTARAVKVAKPSKPIPTVMAGFWDKYPNVNFGELPLRFVASRCIRQDHLCCLSLFDVLRFVGCRFRLMILMPESIGVGPTVSAWTLSRPQKEDLFIDQARSEIRSKPKPSALGAGSESRKPT